jgi:hypothetical protein
MAVDTEPTITRSVDRHEPQRRRSGRNMAETPDDPWAVPSDTDEQAAPVSPEQALAATEGMVRDVTQAFANVAGELGGAAEVVLDAASKAYEHGVFHDMGESDALSGKPDVQFGSGIPRDDVAAYEQGRHDAWKPHLDPDTVPTTPQTSMHEISKEGEEAAKRYTAEKEARERFLDLHKDWKDELGRTTPEDVVPPPPEVIIE